MDFNAHDEAGVGRRSDGTKTDVVIDAGEPRPRNQRSFDQRATMIQRTKMGTAGCPREERG